MMAWPLLLLKLIFLNIKVKPKGQSQRQNVYAAIENKFAEILNKFITCLQENTQKKNLWLYRD